MSVHDFRIHITVTCDMSQAGDAKILSATRKVLAAGLAWLKILYSTY